MEIIRKLVDEDDAYKKRWELANQAYLKGHWIYSSTFDHWYTPEEFIAIHPTIPVDLEKGDYKVYDPSIALMTKLSKLQKTHDEIIKFAGRINSYYLKIPNRDKK